MLQQKRGSNRPHQTSIFIEVFIFYCITQTSPIDMDNFSFAHTLFCHHGRTSEILEGGGPFFVDGLNESSPDSTVHRRRFSLNDKNLFIWGLLRFDCVSTICSRLLICLHTGILFVVENLLS